MSARRAGAAFTIALLAFVLVILFESARLPKVSRLVPGTVALLTLGLLIARAGAQFGIGRSTRRSALGNEESIRPASPDRVRPRDDLVAVGWVLALPALLFSVGIVPSIVVYVTGYVRFRGKAGWPASVAIAAVLCAAVYVLLDRFLGIPLYWGALLGRSGA